MNKLLWIFKVLTQLAADGFTGAITLEFYKGALQRKYKKNIVVDISE